MSETHKERVERYDRYVQFSIAILKRMDHSALEHLVRASEESNEIDGYSRGSGDGEKVSGSKPEEDGSTAAPAIARLCEACQGAGNIKESSGQIHRCVMCNGTGTKRVIDPLAEATEEIFTRLAELSGHATTIGKKLHIVVGAAGRLRGRVSTLADCRGCHRAVLGGVLDPIRAGYCTACESAWRRWKRRYGTDDNGADRLAFEAERPRFDEHIERACPVCIENSELRKAS